MRRIAALVLLVLLAPAAVADAAPKVRCTSGETVHRADGVRLFVVAYAQRIDGVTYRYRDAYVCSKRLRRPRLASGGDEGTEDPVNIARIGRRLVFERSTIGGAGSGTEHCWIDVVRGVRRCVSFDDEDHGPAKLRALRSDGALALLFEDGALIVVRSGPRFFGLPRVVTELGEGGAEAARDLRLGDVEVRWSTGAVRLPPAFHREGT